MNETINLRQARKAKARHAKDIVADANRSKHGVSKSAHKRAKAQAEREGRQLDQHRLDED